MSIELRPLGVTCNIQCQYCYQNPQRDAGNIARRYDMQKMKDAVRAEGGPFTLFGGEPLLLPPADLEELWAWGFAQFGRNSVQTNGTLIDDDHIRMFKQYNVHVGISLDGPGELNDARWNGSAERTRHATQHVEEVIERLCSEGLPPSIIITLHRANATADKLPVLCAWVRHLDRIGVRWLRLHILESEDAAIHAKYALTAAENIDALLAFLALEAELRGLQFDLFADMRRLLTGTDGSTTCIWNGCDPYTTHAVRGIEGQGQRSNCGRTNKDGIDFVKAEAAGYERYLALHATPQACGGCKDCRFFLMCKGQCPGTAIDGDWRNRTEHCEVWKALYALLEQQLAAAGRRPLSLSPLRNELEQVFLAAWSQGQNLSIAQALRRLPQAQAETPTYDWNHEWKQLKQDLREVARSALRSSRAA